MELFECEDYAGGHAHTVNVEAGGRMLGLETGFIAYFEGYTHLEIARTMSVPPGTVKSRLRLALDRMSRSLNIREMAR